jgi:hypothetical protein
MKRACDWYSEIDDLVVGRPERTEYADNVAHYIARVPEDVPRVPMKAQAAGLRTGLRSRGDAGR